MNRQQAVLMFLGFALSAAPVCSQSQTNDLHRRALEVLRQKLAEESPDTGKRKAQPAAAVKEPDFAEVEKQYLEGKISAKQFQKYLQDHKVTPLKLPAVTSPDNTTRPVARLRQETA